MKKIFVVFMFLLLCFGWFAGEQPVIAVYHFENETTAGKYSFSDNTLRNIEEKLRSELIKTLLFEVMSVDVMEAAIAQHKAESYNLNRDRKYQIELGKKISARYIVVGKIRNDDQYYTLFIEMIDTLREAAIGAGNADFINNKDPRDKAINNVISQLIASSKQALIRQQESKKRTEIAEKQKIDEAPKPKRVTAFIGGLVWSSRSEKQMDWYDAKYYCDNLKEDGYYDWRLPTISELRTLVKGCFRTESDGPCGVRDSCRAGICWTSSCFASGYSYDSSGYYSKLGDSQCLWSKSEKVFESSNVWLVCFGSAWITHESKLESSNYFRCVR